MNEDLLTTLMTDIDPVRDLSDDALDELVPYDQLMTRVLAGVKQPAVQAQRERTSIWQRASLRVSAVAAAVVLVASGAVAFLSSSPTAVSGGFALGAVNSSWVEYSATTPSGATYGTWTRSMAAALVSKGRIRTELNLDGLTITPPLTSVKPRVSATQMAGELWATTALRGQTEVAFGFGDITLNVSQGGAPKLHSVPVWVAIATSKPCSAASRCSASAIASLPLTVVVSGYGLPNSEATTGTPIAFTYQTGGKNSTAKPRLLAAIEQVSVSWIQDGRVSNGSLHITAAPVPCGALNGYSLSTNPDGTTLTVKGLIPESTIGDYCTVSVAVSKVIPLRGASANATTLLHTPTGPIRATN
ncbi:MAG TPA: hypothetical protein VII67_05215 [Acidimicrobiales bacterium]